ncbi:MAG TPA: DUF192 domain-containing protein [Candidatus Binatia bacterium]|nr:DUF192 domain-containing protein [Candidatus Binatia bacterium]
MKRILFLVFAIALMGAACNQTVQEDNTRHVPYSDGLINIAGRSISFEHADTPDKQIRGLSNRDTIEENQGMLFTFSVPSLPVFWMKDMRFPIDIVWLKGDEIVDITKNAMPEPGVSDDRLRTYSPKKPADQVLELKTGWADRNGLKIGDKIEVIRVIQPSSGS